MDPPSEIRSNRSSVNSQISGQEGMSFERAKSVFERGITIEKMAILEAQDAKESANLTEIDWNIKILSGSVGTLENDLIDVMTLAKNDEAISISEVIEWRSEQKQHINEIKEMVNILHKQALTIKEEERAREERCSIEKSKYAQKPDPSRKHQFSSCRSAEASIVEAEHNVQ